MYEQRFQVSVENKEFYSGAVAEKKAQPNTLRELAPRYSELGAGGRLQERGGQRVHRVAARGQPHSPETVDCALADYTEARRKRGRGLAARCMAACMRGGTRSFMSLNSAEILGDGVWARSSVSMEGHRCLPMFVALILKHLSSFENTTQIR